MKILFVVANYPPLVCGIGDYTKRILTGLTGKGHETHVLCSKMENADSSIVTGIYPVIEKWNFKAIKTVLSKIREIKPDVLSVQYQTHSFKRKFYLNLLPFVIKTSMLYPPRIVTTMHDFGGPRCFSRIFDKFCKAFFVTLLMFFSDKIIVTDIVRLNKLKKIFGFLLPAVFGDKINFVRVGANIFPDGNDYPLPEDITAFKKDNILIMLFGIIRRDKGIEKAIDMMLRLKKEDIRAKLIVLGDTLDKDYLAELRTQLSKHCLEEHVMFAGKRSEQDVRACFQSSGISILTQIYGTHYSTSTTFATSMAFGVPLVMTHTGYYDRKELIDGENVLLIKPHDAISLYEDVKKLVLNADLRKTVSKNAQEYFNRCLKWEVILKDILRIYSS